MNRAHQLFHDQGLSRPKDGRVLAGVCAAFGRRLGLDPWLTRMLFVLLLVVAPGSQLLVYPLLWLLMPVDGMVTATVRPSTEGG